MAQIIFNVDDSKIEILKDALSKLYPIPILNKQPVFTKTQWVKECVRRWIIKQVAKYQQLESQNNITYTEDDSLIL